MSQSLTTIKSQFAKIAILAVFSLTTSQVKAETPQAYIISPKNGETVTSPVTVRFGLRGMGVAPAGVERANTGHHHLLIDKAELPPLDQPLGSDVKHFGGGQTETTIELSPGPHTLQLILGDHLHRPHQPPVVSRKISIIVEAQPLNGLSIKNLRQMSPTVYRSGQPDKSQFEALAKQGIKHLINLRTKGEISWDEAALAKSYGIEYHELPVNGAKGVTEKNARALSTLLAKLENEKTLVYCASSNRVGALIAFQHGLEGAPVEQAIREGKDWGMTRLELAVREKLQR